MGRGAAALAVDLAHGLSAADARIGFCIVFIFAASSPTERMHVTTAHALEAGTANARF
jgi:hypothetical protein